MSFCILNVFCLSWKIAVEKTIKLNGVSGPISDRPDYFLFYFYVLRLSRVEITKNCESRANCRLLGEIECRFFASLKFMFKCLFR